MATPQEMRIAIFQAKQTLKAADEVADDLARILNGRLRNVNSTWVLSQLKKELRDFNIHTGKWK